MAQNVWLEEEKGMEKKEGHFLLESDLHSS
jgi:hypothetical protein